MAQVQADPSCRSLRYGRERPLCRWDQYPPEAIRACESVTVMRSRPGNARPFFSQKAEGTHHCVQRRAHVVRRILGHIRQKSGNVGARSRTVRVFIENIFWPYRE